MAISSLDDLLNTLATELEQKLNSGSSTYLLKGVTVKRGMTSWNDTDGDRPCIWFVVIEELLEEVMGSNTLTMVSIELHGYADTDGDSSDVMHKLLRDVKYFIHNDYTLKESVETPDMSIIIDEGGSYDEVGISGFMINFMVRSSYDYSTI